MIQRTSTLRRTPLRSVSKRRAKQNREYTKVRKAFLAIHPYCQVCSTRRATEVHHQFGRIGEKLTDESGFMAVCAHCHRFIHQNPIIARAKGWLH